MKTIRPTNPEDMCVVCGATRNLTRHHVIPSMYLKHFPIEYKSNAADDIVVICVEDHVSYEKIATTLKRTIAAECGVIEHVNPRKDPARQLRSLATALVDDRKKIPLERRAVIRAEIVDRLGHEPTAAELNQLAVARDEHRRGTSRARAAKIVNAQQSLDQFASRWRQHFVDVMQM